ncbi:MAG: hypothetical protein ACYCXG_06735 [Acidiferrobacter sp.]
MTSALRICVVLLALAPAVAYGLVDPTRPPWIDPVVTSGPRPGGLRAILIDGPRRLALIDGRWLGIGGWWGHRRVVAISHGRVIVVGANGRQTLHLGGMGVYSGIRKTTRLSAGPPP